MFLCLTAVFPLVASNFELVSGKFKAPVLRGEYNTDLKLHRTVEEYYTSDLDRWLGGEHDVAAGGVDRQRLICH